jgi:hypothetical protein
MMRKIRETGSTSEQRMQETAKPAGRLNRALYGRANYSKLG